MTVTLVEEGADGTSAARLCSLCGGHDLLNVAWVLPSRVGYIATLKAAPDKLDHMLEVYSGVLLQLGDFAVADEAGPRMQKTHW